MMLLPSEAASPPGKFLEGSRVCFARRVGLDAEEIAEAELLLSRALYLLSKNGRSVTLSGEIKKSPLRAARPFDCVVTGEIVSIEIEL